jgi:hypothetical protein
MTNWQVTAKTIYCDAVDDEVTILIYKDLTARCTGCQKYERPDQITQGLIRQKSKNSKRPPRCEGEQCPRVTAYKQKIRAEEGQ